MPLAHYVSLYTDTSSLLFSLSLHPAGTQFEGHILQREAQNSKFDFLRPGTPYNPYYKHMVTIAAACSRTQALVSGICNAKSRMPATSAQLPNSGPPGDGLAYPAFTGSLYSCHKTCLPTGGSTKGFRSSHLAACLQVTQLQAGTDGAKPATAAQQAEQASELQQQAAGKALAVAAAQPQRPLEKPEPEKFSVPVPEGLAYEMVDLIKLTAQHVARNGSGFLTGQLWATGWPCCTHAGPIRGQSAQVCADSLVIKLLTKGSPLRLQCLLKGCTGYASGDTHSSGTWPRSPNTGSPLCCRPGQG